MLNHSGCALDLDLREILHTMYDKENKIQFRRKKLNFIRVMVSLDFFLILSELVLRIGVTNIESI